MITEDGYEPIRLETSYSFVFFDDTPDLLVDQAMREHPELSNLSKDAWVAIAITDNLMRAIG